MDAFLQKYAPLVIGSLSGFDRLIFHGTLRSLAYVEGMRAFLNSAGVLLESRLVRFLGFHGRGNLFAGVSFNDAGSGQRSFRMIRPRRGRGTGKLGRIGWELSAESFGLLQNLRNPRAPGK